MMADCAAHSEPTPSAAHAPSVVGRATVGLIERDGAANRFTLTGQGRAALEDLLMRAADALHQR